MTETQQKNRVQWEEVIEWEEWSSQSMPFWHHALAGSVAGLSEHVSMYPLDTIKTHLQAGAARPRLGLQPTAGGVVATMTAEFGTLGLFRGITAVLSGVVPAHAAMFTTYEAMKSWLRIDQEQPGAMLAGKGAIAGGVSTLAHDGIMTPCDVVKQRLQLGCYDGVMDCVKQMVRDEGAVALFRSMPTTLLMNAPFGAVFVGCNEELKRWLVLPNSGRSEEKRNVLPWYFLSAGISGAVAALATQPLDVIKTRLQTQDCNVRCRKRPDKCPLRPEPGSVAPRYTSFATCAAVLLREEGMRGFYRGTSVRIALHIPAAAICWGTYELVKSILHS